MAIDIPFPFLALMAGFAVALVAFSFKKGEDDLFSPWLAIFGGLVWAIIFIPLDSSTYGYTQAPILNHTQSYNNSTKLLLDKYYYTNSTGKATTTPDIIPLKYPIGQES